MKRLYTLLLVCSMLIACWAPVEQACAVAGPLPDIGVLLGVEAELYGESEEDTGPCHTYIYEVDMTLNEAAGAIVDYTEAVKELGFEPKSISTDINAVKYMTYSADDLRADLALFIMDDAENIANGDTGTFWFVLVVPDAMSFVLGDGGSSLVAGGTRCIGCDGNGSCSYCGGTGSANYGDGYEECIICDGSGTCNICDGAGKY